MSQNPAAPQGSETSNRGRTGVYLDISTRDLIRACQFHVLGNMQ